MLKEYPEYCLVAEQARIKAEKEEDFENLMLIGGSVAAAMPCLVASPVGGGLCLLGALIVAGTSYSLVREAKDISLGRALTGKQFETISELNTKEKELFLTKLLLPIGTWGAVAAPVRAASTAIRKAVVSRTFRFRRGQRLGERSLGRKLSPEEIQAIEKAHRVGYGQKGADGTLAHTGNYTQAQLREKTRILRRAGFSKEEAKQLIKDGVVGESERFLKNITRNREQLQRELRGITVPGLRGQKYANFVNLHRHPSHILDDPQDHLHDGSILHVWAENLLKENPAVITSAMSRTFSQMGGFHRELLEAISRTIDETPEMVFIPEDVVHMLKEARLYKSYYSQKIGRPLSPPQI